VPHHAVRLVDELLIAANGPASQLSNAELIPLIVEVRDYCIADGASAALLELVKSLKSQHGIGSDQLIEPSPPSAGPNNSGTARLHSPRTDRRTRRPDRVAVEVPGNHVGPMWSG